MCCHRLQSLLPLKQARPRVFLHMDVAGCSTGRMRHGDSVTAHVEGTGRLCSGLSERRSQAAADEATKDCS